MAKPTKQCNKCHVKKGLSCYSMNQTRGGAGKHGKKYFYRRGECKSCYNKARRQRGKARASAGFKVKGRAPAGVCDLCGKPNERVIDHCHDDFAGEDGSVRGIVCSVPCNSQILGGCTSERLPLLEKAAVYLRRYLRKQVSKLAAREGLRRLEAAGAIACEQAA